jgi:predicted DNA-binding transcriptional regulator YafY
MRDETFTSPGDFDCLEYVMRSIAMMPASWLVEVLLEMTLEEARQRVPPALATLEQVPEGVLLRCYTEHLDWMAYELVNLQCPFIVRHPPELRDALRQLAEKIISYSERSSTTAS